MNRTLEVGLIDYDMGNLKSVAKALEKTGSEVRLVNEPSRLKGIDVLVLPGVGAFDAAVRNLKKRRLFGPVQNWIETQKPFLGICLGYQLLFEKGEEGRSRQKGLGIFKGNVRRFPKKRSLKVPHMGWNRIRWDKKSAAGSGLAESIPDGSYFYFVHSYFPVPSERKWVSTTTKYGIPFASSITKGRLFACQFHPEKSGENGLRLLKNFLASAA